MKEIFRRISLENWSWGKNFKRISLVKIHTHASLARAVFNFKTFFVVKVKKSEKKWKSEKVKSIFGPLNFFVFRYVEGGVLGNNYISIKKCRTTFLWVLNFGQVGGRWKFFQNMTTGMIFLKMVSNLSVLEGIFETKFQGRFFSKNFLKGFLL